jgi:Flp pilus assembly protein TadB
MPGRLRKFWETLTGAHMPTAKSIADDPTHMHNIPKVQEEKPHLPIVWWIIIGMVIVGFFINIFMRGGLVVWPFIFAVAVLLIINDASEKNAVGVPPFQAYALFFGTLIIFFLFVALVSKINAWLVILLVIAAAVYVARDWKIRRQKRNAIDKLRLAGLCVVCKTPVGSGVNDVCPNCGTLVNPERLNLFHLGRAISMRAQASNARQALTGSKPGRSDVKAQKLQQQRGYRYKKK